MAGREYRLLHPSPERADPARPSLLTLVTVFWVGRVRQTPTQQPLFSLLALGRCFPFPNVSLPEYPEINNTSVSDGIR